MPDIPPERAEVVRSQLRFDDVDCERCDRYCGYEGETVYVVVGEGCVCSDCITTEEVDRARPQR